MKNKKILLIEDDNDLVALYSAKIKKYFKLTVAKTGESGLALLEKEKFDLILLDIVLPGIDGIEVLKKIKKNSKTKKIPVFLLSNLSAENFTTAYQELGALDYIVKSSLTPEQLLDKIRKFLSEKK